jgi:hypothetical protein
MNIAHGFKEEIDMGEIDRADELAASLYVEHAIFLDFRASITVYMVHWRGGE